MRRLITVGITNEWLTICQLSTIWKTKIRSLKIINECFLTIVLECRAGDVSTKGLDAITGTNVCSLTLHGVYIPSCLPMNFVRPDAGAGASRRYISATLTYKRTHAKLSDTNGNRIILTILKNAMFIKPFYSIRILQFSILVPIIDWTLQNFHFLSTNVISV